VASPCRDGRAWSPSAYAPSDSPPDTKSSFAVRVDFVLRGTAVRPRSRTASSQPATNAESAQLRARAPEGRRQINDQPSEVSRQIQFNRTPSSVKVGATFRFGDAKTVGAGETVGAILPCGGDEHVNASIILVGYLTEWMMQVVVRARCIASLRFFASGSDTEGALNNGFA
jgi:hypothetical protein